MGMICTSTPHAVRVGVELLEAGGNAVDAAIGAAAALVVTEPTANGLGGDAFAIVAEPDGDVIGLNASGRSPRALTPERARAAGFADALPWDGWWGVTVPGVISGWSAAHGRFGRLPWARVLAPAIALAADGFAVSPVVAAQWRSGGEQRFATWPDRQAFADAWLPGGRAPRAGELFRAPDLAATLDRLAGEGERAFYQGELGARLCAWARETGGLLVAEDLAGHRAEWVRPLAVRYRDATVFELPPNGQGLVASLALRVLDGLPEPAGEDLLATSRVHRLAEALRLAFSVGDQAIADPACLPVAPERLLDEDYLATVRARFSPERVRGDPSAVPLREPGTVYLAVADDEGREVSWIQSNYTGFGSGVVVPGTGISLQNRGCGFTLRPGHPNQVGPAKRPFHTIIPGWVRTDRGDRCAFGVMGGQMQPQGHVQVLGALLRGLSPQESCDLPRFRVVDHLRLALEGGGGADWGPVEAELGDLGHVVRVSADRGSFGGAQVVWRGPDGALRGGTEPRKDGGAPGVSGGGRARRPA